jgi:hypothetical protein
MAKLSPARALIQLVPEPGPRRVYGVAILINTFGFGLIMTAMTLYATRVIHLTARQAGLGLTIAGLVGLLVAIPVGSLADRRGPRDTLRAVMLVQSLAAIGYLLVHDFAGFVVVATVDLAALTASMSIDAALLRRVSGEDPAAFRATTQAIANAGIALGFVGYGFAVQIDTLDAYRALFLVNALTFLAGWAILRRLPRYEPLPAPPAGQRRAALTDKAFVAYAVLSGAMAIEYFVIIFLLPLWLVDHTRAPRWSMALLLLLSTGLVILFQVRVGARVNTIQRGGIALRRAGLIFLVSCSLMGLAAGLPGWFALLLLAVAVALHTSGELWHSAGVFALDFGLAPAHAQGQYQGVAGIGTGAGQAVAPVILIGLCLSLGRVGWLGLGASFALIGLTAPALARWGERTRPGSMQPSDAPQVVGAD